MDRFFDANNPIMRALSRLVDLAILNIITLVCSLPVFTIGTSMTAMNYVLIKYVKEEESYTKRLFTESFKSNFAQGVKLGMIFIILALLGAGDMFILHGTSSRMATGLMIVITVISLYILAIAVYAFSLLSRYENTVVKTLTNALKLSMKHPVSTAGIILVWLVWIGIIIFLHKAAALAILLYGFTLPGYMCMLIIVPVFRKLEENQENE